jgi:hypothetical protein
MRICPIGITTRPLSALWPLWEAALLRRFGRAPSWGCLAAGFLPETMPRLWRCHLAGLDDGVRPIWRRPPIVHEGPAPPAVTLPDLDPDWPSDAPIGPPHLVIVERLVPREYPVPGAFIDLLY